MTYVPRSEPAPPSSPSSVDLAALAPIALAFLDGGYESVKQSIRTWGKDDPFDALIGTVVGGGIAFWLAERETNPACATPYDAILYAATALSVGYDNLFPTTPMGHTIASLIQTFGPALAAGAFDPSAAEVKAKEDAEADVNRQILARLEDIVRLLETKP